MVEPMSTRVLLIDDHALFRRGVAQLIESDPDLKFVGEACDGVRGIELVSQVEPDIVLIDLNMKGLSGIATLQGIRKLNLKSRLEAAVWALNRGSARSGGDSLQ